MALDASGNWYPQLPDGPPLDDFQQGAGAGTTQVYSDASPPAAPDDPMKAALYYPTGGGTLSQWDGANWV